MKNSKKKRFSTIYEYVVDESNDGKNVYTYLEDVYNYSTRTFRYIIKEGKMTINNELKIFTDILHEGDVVKVFFPMEKADGIGKPVDVNVIYEDDDILVVNKQAGVVVHVTKSHPDDTLQNGIYYMWEKSGNTFKTRFVNRLDMDTSGIVVIAKNKYVHHFIQDQGVNNLIDKKYIMIVHGILDKKEGVLEYRIKREAPYALKREVREDGKEAITKYKVLREFDDYSLVEAKLITGRTHQLRVHFSHIGHPIIGDNLYNDREDKYDLISHQALHARTISFVHPRINKRVIFEADIPDDIKEVIYRLEKN